MSDQSTQSAKPAIPRAAKWLGGLGALPFVFLTAAIHEIGGLQNPMAPGALVAYGAIILTFLGGIQWGQSMMLRDDAGATWERLMTSILPSLVAWASLFMAPKSGVLVLAGAFLFVLSIDLLWHRKGRSPGWYPTLRIALTATVVSCLVIARLGL